MKDKEPKLKRMSRRNLHLSAIKYLEEETGFHATSIKFGDGYLIDDCKDSICWFRFKEIKGYMFAMWHKDEFNMKAYGPEYENAELVLFTQADLTRDKFKPSRSAFKTPMFRWTFKPNDGEWQEEWNDCGGSDMIRFIKKHKYRAFFIQSFSDWDPWEYISVFNAFKEYYLTKFYYWKEDIKEKLKVRKVSKDIIKRLKNVNGCRFTLSEYNNCYPKLHMFVYFRSKNSEDIILYNRIMDYIEDKYWNDVSISYIDLAEKFKRFANSRIKKDGNGETLLWKKLK